MLATFPLSLKVLHMMTSLHNMIISLPDGRNVEIVTDEGADVPAYIQEKYVHLSIKVMAKFYPCYFGI